HLEVEVDAGDVAGVAHRAEEVTRGDLVAGGNADGLEVAIPFGAPAGAVDEDVIAGVPRPGDRVRVAVAVTFAGADGSDGAAVAGVHGDAALTGSGRGDIDAAVEATGSGDGVSFAWPPVGGDAPLCGGDEDTHGLAPFMRKPPDQTVRGLEGEDGLGGAAEDNHPVDLLHQGVDLV